MSTNAYVRTIKMLEKSEAENAQLRQHLLAAREALLPHSSAQCNVCGLVHRANLTCWQCEIRQLRQRCEQLEKALQKISRESVAGWSRSFAKAALAALDAPTKGEQE